MNRNFNFEMVNGFRGTMNNVNEIAQLVKAELLNTSNVVVVNGFRFWIGGVDWYDGYVLYVETHDGNPNPCYRKCYVHQFYQLGKIRRGIAKCVADFLTLNAEYGMYNTPMFVWEDGKMVKYVELNNDMEENDMADMTGIDENGFAIDGLEYVNKNMKTVDVELIKDCIKDFSEDSYVMDRVFGWNRERRVDFEEFCDRLWTDYVWERVLDSGCTDEALENETRYVMEFNDRVRYIVEHEIDWFGINCYDEIEVVDLPKNYSPCLERVVDTIKDYVDNYEGILMDYNGYSASICVPWDEFDEDDMKMLIEYDGFEGCVVRALMGRDIKDVLVYDDGVYVSVDAKMCNKVA